MLNLANGRTLYYGKGDVLTYRTYAKPLTVNSIPESSFRGDSNVIFAHNLTFSVSSEQLLSSFTEGDNSIVVATDSMKNFILRHAGQFNGSTTEGFLAFVSRRFFETYAHITAIEIRGDRIPFQSLQVRGEEGFEDSGLVYRRSHNDHASASLVYKRESQGTQLVSHWCGLTDLQLIKVSGSSFFGFIRDEYTTLPDSYDRPLFIFLNIYWCYTNIEDAAEADLERYVPAEQIRDIAHHVFHEYKTPSIQYLIYQIALLILTRFPQLSEVRFESNNRTWETVVEPDPVTHAGVFTEPRPPFGFQGFSLTREDLDHNEETAVDSNASAGKINQP
ncbi:factor-independent urate hydroxylase [Paenibacillus solisilvae]|uniref:Uricase n=1 Tax=Paenibacillus solisilvae TaxID=2486751 RepID=A0ABW0VUP4_9BACL